MNKLFNKLNSIFLNYVFELISYIKSYDVKVLITTIIIYIGGYTIDIRYNSFDKNNFIEYDILDNKKIIFQNLEYPYIDLPKNNDDLKNFTVPYMKFYPTSIQKEYPSIDKVMSLFKSNSKILHPNKMNFMFLSFAGYWVHCFLHTIYKDNIPYQENGSVFIPKPIYGSTIKQENILKTKHNGKIKMRDDNTPLHLYEITQEEQKIFNMINPHNDTNFFICGITRANVSVGTYIIHTILQRNHNRLCDIIIKHNPSLDDTTIFNLAKTINFGQLIKLIVGPYIHAINNKINIKSDYLWLNSKEYFITWEYNLCYQFHLCLPEKIDNYSLKDIAFNSEIIYSKNIGEWIQIFCNTQCNQQIVTNCQDYFLQVERKAIEVSRNVNILSYCEFRQKLNLFIPKTFEDITGEKILSNKLKEVYKDVNNIELYVGMNSEPTLGFFGETMSKLLAIIALPGLSKEIKKVRSYIYNIDKQFLNLIDDYKTLDEFIKENLTITEIEKITKPISFTI
jgi:hypothetical protein